MMMNRSDSYPSDVAFTDSVKSIQARKGSRAAYERMERAKTARELLVPVDGPN